MVELAEEPVGQVPEHGGVPVAGGASARLARSPAGAAGKTRVSSSATSDHASCNDVCLVGGACFCAQPRVTLRPHEELWCNWRRHLGAFTPALAQMYEHETAM
jgi:hypothetical protein